MVGKRLKARWLITVEGFTCKDAASAIDVSYKTVLKWYHRYQWKDAKKGAIEETGGFHLYFGYFLNYVRSTNPSIHNQVKDLWFAYLKKLQDRYYPEKVFHDEE
ncbi:helix-turn-helix domain-containing protein [Paraflavitalea speifideaquila]|nr:helix-turn-helix domain-containing protein [Paraflavitalea speifideiaquila]